MALLAQVRQAHPHLILRFSGEDAFRTPTADLCHVYDAVAPYVDRLGTPDTVGVATPEAVKQTGTRFARALSSAGFGGSFSRWTEALVSSML